MPKITAHSKVFRDWEGLLGACAKNAALMPNIEPLRAELEAFLAQAREVKLQQESLMAEKATTTQRLFEIEVDGTEAASKLRALAFSNLGSHTELLTQFGLVPKPRRVRRTRNKKSKAARAAARAAQAAKAKPQAVTPSEPPPPAAEQAGPCPILTTKPRKEDEP